MKLRRVGSSEYKEFSVYRSGVNENTANTKNGFPDFAQSGDIAEQINAELLGAAKERHKRLSDQRRAELETLMALSKMTNRFMNVPSRGGRQLDSSSTKVNGKTRRSVFEMNMKNLRKLFKLSAKLGYKGNAAYPVVS
ncbi:uncharacterized protein LOC143182990 [Calliopsis andreniformis]|uniref:uncharacterized protein LOC143182990 n=1 Tax=Calliopsis andreniformis TaxID=337506 RepID=UPI003FCE6652